MQKRSRALAWVVVLGVGSLVVWSVAAVAFLGYRQTQTPTEVPQTRPVVKIAAKPIPQKTAAKETTTDQLNAQLVKKFEDRIASLLISPSTAKFSAGNGSWKGRVFTASGIVDAQNKFGAMLRGSWMIGYNLDAKSGEGAISLLSISNKDISLFGAMHWEYGTDGNLLTAPAGPSGLKPHAENVAELKSLSYKELRMSIVALRFGNGSMDEKEKRDAVTAVKAIKADGILNVSAASIAAAMRAAPEWVIRQKELAGLPVEADKKSLWREYRQNYSNDPRFRDLPMDDDSLEWSFQQQWLTVPPPP